VGQSVYKQWLKSAQAAKLNTAKYFFVLGSGNKSLLYHQPTTNLALLFPQLLKLINIRLSSGLYTLSTGPTTITTIK
jgi:hypothetical protein